MTYQPAVSLLGIWNHKVSLRLPEPGVERHDSIQARGRDEVQGHCCAHRGDVRTCRKAPMAASRSRSRWTSIRAVVGGFGSGSPSAQSWKTQTAIEAGRDGADSNTSSENWNVVRTFALAPVAAVSNRKRTSGLEDLAGPSDRDTPAETVTV